MPFYLLYKEKSQKLISPDKPNLEIDCMVVIGQGIITTNEQIIEMYSYVLNMVTLFFLRLWPIEAVWVVVWGSI